MVYVILWGSRSVRRFHIVKASSEKEALDSLYDVCEDASVITINSIPI